MGTAVTRCSPRGGALAVSREVGTDGAELSLATGPVNISQGISAICSVLRHPYLPSQAAKRVGDQSTDPSTLHTCVPQHPHCPHRASPSPTLQHRPQTPQIREHDLQSERAAEAQSVCFSRHQWEMHLPPRSQQHGQRCSRAGDAMVVWTHLSPALGLGNKLGPHLHHPTQLGDGGGHGSLPQHGVRAASSHTKQLCSRCGRHLVTSCSP